MRSSWRWQLQGPSPSGDLVSENIPIIYHRVLCKAKDTHPLPTHTLLDAVMKCIYVEICARILHKVIFCKGIDLTWASSESKGSSHWDVHLRKGHKKWVLKKTILRHKVDYRLFCLSQAFPSFQQILTIITNYYSRKKYNMQTWLKALSKSPSQQDLTEYS